MSDKPLTMLDELRLRRDTLRGEHERITGELDRNLHQAGRARKYLNELEKIQREYAELIESLEVGESA